MDKKFTFDFDFFNCFGGICLIIDENGNILKYNPASKAKLKLDDEKKNFFDFFETNDQEELRKIIASCGSQNKSCEHNAVIKIENKNIYVEIFIWQFFDNENSEKDKKYYFILANDITDRKAREEELQRFYYVAENTVNPLQITDIDGRMIYVNPAFLKVSGYNKEELIGENPKIFGSKKQMKKFWAEMWNTIKAGKVWIGDVENRKKNGEPFYTQLLISPILDEDQKVTGYFGIHRDLSEKKTLEKQLIQTQKMESIGTLAAGIAHEVGNPLASISALVQVAQRTTTDDSVKEKLELVKSQVNRISKIIRDLVDFSRPSNYEFQLTDINKNLEEAVEITKVGIKAKDINFELDLNKNLPLLPLVADQIQQVFVNILLNATDALIESKKLNKKITVKSYIDEEDNVVISFTDNGTGISEENLSKIFEPFFTTKKEGKGTGLGLWVSYGIIKSFNGEIKVSSIYNQETTFTIILPKEN